MKPKWMISVRSHIKTKNFIFTGAEGQSPVELYKTVKKKAAEIRERYEGRPVTVEVISRTFAFKPPKDSTPPRNHHWCPYCIKYRIFIWSERRGLSTCPICGLSDQDFWFKYYNGIFYREHMDYLRNRRDK